jgi:hypothetical protein
MKKARRNSIDKLILAYAKKIRLDDPVVKEMKAASRAMQIVKKFNVTHVFIDDYVEDKRRIYANFCFFGQGYHAEIANPREKSNEGRQEIFVLSLKKGLSKVSIQNYENFDLVSANSESRLTVAFYLVNGESFFLNASGNNCEELIKIYSAVLKSKL